MLLRSIVVGSAFLIACSGTSTGTGTSSSSSSSSGSSSTAEAKACTDTIDAIAKAAQRCGGDYQTNYDQALQSAAGGDCSKVVKIRDETSLRGTCIPSLNAESCTDLMAGTLDASCKGQLERTASFEPTLYPASAFAGEVDEP